MAIIFGTNFNDNGTLFPILTGTSLADTIFSGAGDDLSPVKKIL